MPATRWVQIAQQRIDALDIPGARLGVSPPAIPGIRTNLAGADVSIAVVGDDLATLETTGWTIVDRLQGIAGLHNLEPARTDRTPLLRVDVDRERASALGLNVSDVGEAVRGALHGVVPTRYSAGGIEYDVRVGLPRRQLATSDDIGGIRLFRGADGRPVYVRDVAAFSLEQGPAHIERENQVRLLRINGDVDTGRSDVATINREIRARLADLELAPGLSLIFGGEEEAIRETNRQLLTVIALAVFLVFIVLAVQYERLSSPLVTVATVPLALVGVVGALWVTGTNLSAPVMLGVILLVGIVVNNAILLVEYIEIGRREFGLSPFEAVVEAGRTRFRPILMTTLTTVFGMLPLALGLGEGAELMRPLALAVIGGLLTSTLLTLLVPPSLYLAADGVAGALVRWLTGREPADADHTQPGYADAVSPVAAESRRLPSR
jgi:multidrug efflux pump subunit AcrB